MMISKMKPGQEKNINNIVEDVGASRQNIKKMLTSLEVKEYVVINKSVQDLRALNDKKLNIISVLNVVIILLTAIVTICGLYSFSMEFSYNAFNQYGQSIKMWGAGIYAHDLFFKAPIFVGSDFTILFLILPLTLFILIKMLIKLKLKLYIQNLAVMSLLLYYCIAFGGTYNNLRLLYIALFRACFYSVCFLFVKLKAEEISRKKLCDYNIPKGVNTFLFLSGIALFVACLLTL